ncbi:hypothetical protein CRUP_001005, partial [Coryphaenoides rupestris]
MILLEAGCFRDLSPTLRFLDLSSNRLSTLDPAALGGLRAHANLTNAVGVPFVLLAEDWDLCLSLRRTTDVAMLVIMFLWFSMVISYLVYYVRHNQEDTRRHLEYLKSLHSRQ